MDSPSGRVPEQAPKRFLVAIEACGGGTPDLSSPLMFLGYMGLYRRKKSVGGVLEGPRRQGHTQGGGRVPHPRGQPGTLLAQLFHSTGFFWSIKYHQKLARQLDSVWYSFSVKLKNKEKTEAGTGL